MAELLPWSIPGYVVVDDDAELPWSGPAYVDVLSDTPIELPWSNNASVILHAPVTIDWRPLKGPAVRLPTTTGWKHGRALAPVSWPGTTVSELLASPMFEIAHRGFGKLSPEMTMTAYLHAARLGATSLEISVVRSSDGRWVCNHDDDTLRMTGVNYYIPTTPWKGVIDQLRSTWRDTDTPGRDPVPMSLLDEVVEAFGRTHVLWIQPKRDIDAQDLVEWMNASPYIDPEHGVVKLWRGQYPYADYAKTHGGWKSWGIWLKSNSAKPALTVHFDTLGQDWSASQAQWDEVLSSGKRVVGHVVETAEMRDIAIAMGATGLMAARPVLNL